MMLFCKCTAFAYCYSDGFNKDQKYSKDQQIRQIKKLPSFFSFFSYTNFLGSSVAGPIFDYYDFDNFINLKGNFSNIPFPLFDALKNLTVALLYGSVTVLILPYFDPLYLSTDDFGKHPLWYRLLLYNATIILIRVRYYCGWLLI